MDRVKSMVTINLALTALIGIALIITLIFTSGKSNSGTSQETISAEIDFARIEVISFSTPLHNVVYSLDGEKSYNLRFEIALSFDKKSGDFKNIQTTLGDANKKKVLISDINDLVREKSFEEIARTDSKNVLETEILELLRKKLGTTSLLKVSIPSYYHDKP